MKKYILTLLIIFNVGCVHNNFIDYNSLNTKYFKGSYDDRYIPFDNLIAKSYTFLEYCYWSNKYHNYRNKYNISDNFVFRANNVIINGNGELRTKNLGQFNYGNYFEIPEGSKLIIGNNVHISKYVTIYNARYDDDTFIRTGEIKTFNSTTIIGDNVFIYPHVHIDGGVTIGDNVVILANTYIDQDIPNNTIYRG